MSGEGVEVRGLVIAVFPVEAMMSRLEQQQDGTQGVWSRPRVPVRGAAQLGSFFSSVGIAVSI